MIERGKHVKKGDSFGEWIALDDDYLKNTRRYAFCRCSCGNEKEIRTDMLIHGRSKSCGCLRNPSIDFLIGRRYGSLVIIGEAKRTSKVSVLCKCDCGNIVSKHRAMVLNGTRTSCGRCNYSTIKVGDKFGRWEVIGESRKSLLKGSYHLEWLCKCSCNKHTIAYVDEQNLKRGLSNSCGCLKSELSSQRLLKHGETDTRLYIIWVSMRERCYNLNSSYYKDYGGRGISIAKEWDEFLSFKEWALSHGYSDDLTIDRIDVNGNYEPSNCRWATILEQNNNKRNNIRIEYHGVIRTASEWGRELGIKSSEIRRLYHKGYSLEQIIRKKGVKLP